VQAVVDENFIRHLTEFVRGADPVISYVQDLLEGTTDRHKPRQRRASDALCR